MKPIERNKKDVFFFADHYGWQEIDFQENIGLAIYYKDCVKMNVYLSKMTVVLNISGKQISLKNVSMIEFEKICIEPAKKLR